MKIKLLFDSTCLFPLLSCDDRVNEIPKNIDHLVYTAPSLEEGINEIESLLGIKPVLGGRHPNFGTHNALLSLGESTYLEVMAPDLDLPVPKKGRLLNNAYNHKPKLTTWVLREEQIENMYSEALEKGLKLGKVDSGKREEPDGTILAWKLTDPYAFPLDGTVPFLISWGDTPHPAKAVPKAGELVEFEIQHPNPDKVREGLKNLGVNIKITKAEKPKIRAKIKTEKGIVILE
ncbi:MAG: VOC family protein [Ignavibacteriae bacterium]|nr:VOC family protein [Ignavibacteriota bacterium]NOH00057.1 VOC family protein [Ignavibacteriota bacterium]